ncbi:MAG TPA: DNA-binding response regulator [Opitutae bacterium]|nr:DNA-binding response regulator [Opitutae bacterium]
MKNRPNTRTPTSSPKQRATALVVEDHQSIREMLHEILEAKLGLKVVEAGTTDEGVAAAQRVQPDLAIIDIGLPGINGIELIRRLRRELPDLRILVFSSLQNLQIVRSVMQAGTQGFVDKSESFSVLRQAVLAVLNGKTWFNHNFNELLREALAHPGPDAQLAYLTPREREVLLLVTQSNSSKEVAVKLSVSVKTAENHRTNLMRKLGLHDTAALVRFAFRHDLIDARLG